MASLSDDKISYYLSRLDVKTIANHLYVLPLFQTSQEQGHYRLSLAKHNVTEQENGIIQ